jgi:hypothetical protein
MHWVIALTFSTVAIGSVSAATAQSKPPHAKAAAKTSAHSHTRRSKTRVGRRAPVAAYQMQPAPERYQEIQKALADRGYFKGEANGQWGPDSVDALQRFQTDQKIPNDGKINSLSLIGLSLGPKHDSAAPAPLTAPSSGQESSSTPATPPN